MPQRERAKYLIYGAGLSGLAAMRLLKRHKREVVLVDDMPSQNLGKALKRVRAAKIEYYFGHIPSKVLNEVETIVVSPGVPLNRPLLLQARQENIQIISELELGYQFRGAPIVAVTGTNGKSTVTALVAAILRQGGYEAIATGNIGFPLCDACVQKRARRFNSVLATEVSSFQLETIKDFRPLIAALLNVRPDHLDRHSSFAEYQKAKFRITENQTAEDCLILNKDDEACQQLARLTKAQVFWFSVTQPVIPGAYIKDGMFFFDDGEKETAIAALSDTSLPGRHNQENLLAAILAGSLYEVSCEHIKTAIKGFKGLEHRLELVTVHNGVKIYNDSKSTCVDSLEKALESFTAPIVLIAGGKDKKDDYAALAALVQRKVKLLVLIGQVKTQLKRLWGQGLRIYEANDLKYAVKIAIAQARSGEVLLFSPGCPSYDMFKNFEERGHCFKNAIYELIESKPSALSLAQLTTARHPGSLEFFGQIMDTDNDGKVSQFSSPLAEATDQTGLSQSTPVSHSSKQG